MHKQKKWGNFKHICYGFCRTKQQFRLVLENSKAENKKEIVVEKTKIQQ